ncbi:hypothetical protein NFI95_05290 [Acetobacteraceae bacterium KSS8]|uniref:Uncharacterized protein n=1 Tax=Endosaccharibacter trunci TaxID=2812733 RepID=A0ABT1W4P8_9PROT|nr:hypothetical protein [Acetobacteraceae bacterium KSS8]
MKIRDVLTASSSRRALLRGLLLGGAALGAGACTVTHGGTVITATLDLNRMLTDGQAILTALNTALLIPGIAAMLGANFAAAETALAAAGAAMTELKTLAGSSISVSIDVARVQTLAASLLADFQTVLSLLSKLAPGSTATSRLALLISAATTLVPLVQSAAGLPVSTTAMPGVRMTETEALRIAQGG